MAIDAYSSCPCGSGKKFKWCCQPIHQDIDRAFHQDEQGQHEAALRTIQEVVQQHSNNAEAWGRQSLLLYRNQRREEAERSLEKAFEINPKYAFGYMLQGMFRQNEDEVTGALLLFRKAADAYDPEARDILAQLYQMIGECELQMNRPVASRAAIKIAIRCRPNAELQEQLDVVFGENSHYPLSARKEYSFQSPSSRSAPERLESWKRALGIASSGKLADVLRAFEALTVENPEDWSAWYNLALAHAWLGNNNAALEAIDRYLVLQVDEKRATAAAALGEVLRLADGMEEQSDYHSYNITVFADPNRIVRTIEAWGKNRRITGVRVQEEEGVITGLIVGKDRGLTPELEAAALPRFQASFILAGGVLAVTSPREDWLRSLADELLGDIGPLKQAPVGGAGPCRFTDVASLLLFFPVGISDPEQAKAAMARHVDKELEQNWIHVPRKSLGGLTPVDAAQNPVARNKLLGCIQFLEECCPKVAVPYDFDNLRRKLGLIPGATAEPMATATPEENSIAALTAEGLDSLDVTSLSAEQVEQAYLAAQKQGSADLAARFAKALVALPVDAKRPDRFPWYSLLIKQCMDEGKSTEALELVDAGQKADCEHNSGLRRNEYELRRGQVLAKSGDVEDAKRVFDGLLARMPSELQFRVYAVEALLAAKQGAWALRVAEEGIVKAREKNNRDCEAHLQELAGAARRYGA